MQLETMGRKRPGEPLLEDLEMQTHWDLGHLISQKLHESVMRKVRERVVKTDVPPGKI